MIKIPKYLVGDVAPDGDGLYIVRTRNPLLIARCEPVGFTGLQLHCWPPDLEQTVPANKLAKILGAMAAIYAEEIEEQPGPPRSWSYLFGTIKAPPDHLVCDGIQGRSFTGVLRLAPPVAWLIPHKDNIGALWAVVSDSEPSPAQVEESWSWWLEYVAAEERLDDLLED